MEQGEGGIKRMGRREGEVGGSDIMKKIRVLEWK